MYAVIPALDFSLVANTSTEFPGHVVFARLLTFCAELPRSFTCLTSNLPLVVLKRLNPNLSVPLQLIASFVVPLHNGHISQLVLISPGPRLVYHTVRDKNSSYFCGVDYAQGMEQAESGL